MKLEGNRPPGKPWHRWEVKQIGGGGGLIGVKKPRTDESCGLF